MAKPSTYLGWVPSGSGSYIQNPTTGQKTTGFTEDESPPFEYINWLFYITDQWVQWLDSATAGLPISATVLATTGNISNNSYSLTSLASTTGLKVGMAISGTGIPAGTYIEAISGSTVTMTQKATASTTGLNVTFSHVFATGASMQTMIDNLDAAVRMASDLVVPIDSTSSPYQINPSDSGKVFMVNSPIGAMTFLMYSILTDNLRFTISDAGYGADTNNITLTPYGTQNIVGLNSNYIISAPGFYGTFEMQGGNWYRVR